MLVGETDQRIDRVALAAYFRADLDEGRRNE